MNDKGRYRQRRRVILFGLIIPAYGQQIDCTDIADTAQLLEIDDAAIGRYRSYEKAAELIDSLPDSIRELAKEPAKLKELPGIGDHYVFPRRVRQSTHRLVASLDRTGSTRVFSISHVAGFGTVIRETESVT